VVFCTGHQPKTHGGAQSAFARLARTDPRIAPGHVSFLSRAYQFKTVADYDAVVTVSRDDAERALADAADMVEAIAGLV
jgi:uncharacterized protein (UPF0332 family)